MTHIYTGTEQTSSVGEVLSTGDEVRVVFERDAFGVAILGVDKASDAFDTGRTYTVWSVPAASVGEAVPAGLSVWCGSGACYKPATLVVARKPLCGEHAAAFAELDAERIGETLR